MSLRGLLKRIEAPASESGMTIIEVLVAAIVLAMGAAATFGILSSATKNAQRAKASQVALDHAQEEMEKLQSVDYDQLALTTTPQHATSSLNPNSRVVNGNFAVIREPPSEYGTMVVKNSPLYGGGFVAGGVVIPGPIPFSSGDVTGKLYRYVVWRNDPTCGEVEGEPLCPGAQDYKQLIVAAKLDTPGNQSGERGYVEVQSKVIDPASLEEGAEGGPKEEGEEGPEEEGGGGNDGPTVTAQQFFLTNTPCDAGGATVREEITGDHQLHNTLGTCASGPQTGGENGAPDALLLGAPPDPDPLDDFNPLLFDYANDSYLEPTPDTDKGVQILHDDTSGCYYDPTGTTNPEAQVHRWVSDPMPSDFSMTDTVTLEFYTRTLNDGLYPGTLCVYLFDRHETGPAEEPLAEDALLTRKGSTDAYWTYASEEGDYWPRNAWTKVRLTVEFNGAPFTVPLGDRLGVGLSVDPANTPADAIPIMYDHPNYPTRLEVDTDTPIEASEGGA